MKYRLLYLLIPFFINCSKKELSKTVSERIVPKRDLNSFESIDSLPRLITPEFMINVLDYGAKPNDGKDDAEAIQKAIDEAIYSGKSGKVFIPAGIYDLDNGIVAARLQPDGDYFFNTITISGAIATSSPNQNLGRVTAFNIRHKGFGIALQLARQCVIENIAFVGVARYNMSIKNIVEYKIEDWGEKGNQSTNINSPSCAISIDPFHSYVPINNRYIKDEKYYKNKSTGGSSMLTIRGCSFERFYIAIANNSSGAIANGDNIRAESCHAQFCHTFWSCGQTQSRGNSIDNVYAIFLHTFINGRQIGSQYGTPPMVSNVNIAGFCKELVNFNTGFSGIHFYRSYAESIWSLGIAIGTAVSFYQCQFQFSLPSEEVFTAPFLLYSNCPVSFRDCSIEYFSNCLIKMPFKIYSPAVKVEGGTVEGGLILAGGISNYMGEAMHRVKFDNTFIKCEGKVAGVKPTAIPNTNLENQIVLGGDILTGTDGSIFMNGMTTYNLEGPDAITLEIDQKTKRGYFKSSKPGFFQVGDNLLPEENINTKMADMDFAPLSKVRAVFGFVSKIVDNKVEITGIPYGAVPGNYNLYKVNYPKFNIKNLLKFNVLKLTK